ncbi:MAG: hypothetical protein WD794_10875 [Mycobacteriales bacterium]
MRAVSVNGEESAALGADGPFGDPPVAAAGEEVEEVEPDEVIFRVTDYRVVVFSAAGGSGPSRWGRWLGELDAGGLASLLRELDPVARALIEAKRLTGSLVELHPQDREMFASGFKAIREDGGWLQANFRDRGQVTRLMRIRPAGGAAALSGGALALAAVAAQAQAAELGREVRAIGQAVAQLRGDSQDDLVGAVENVVGQVEDMVELLRAHGADGAGESDVSVVRDALGEAGRRCVLRLGTAVGELEAAGGLGSATGAEQVVTAGAEKDVVLYLGLAERLEAATVEFAFAQVAFDCHSGRPHVAVTRAEQVTRQVERFRRDVGDACGRLAQLDGSVRGVLLPWWRVAGKEIVASAGMAVAGAGGGAVLAAAPAAAEAVKDGSGSGGASASGVRSGAVLGAVAGLATGLYRGAKKTVHEVRAKAPLEERLERLAAAGARGLESRATVPAIDWLQQLTKELARPEG